MNRKHATIMLGSLAALGLAGHAHATPIFHAPFNGDANDASGGGNHLTAYGDNDPTVTSSGGVTGGGYASFDGSNLFNTDFVPVTGNADVTLSLWLRTEQSNAGTAVNETAFAAGWGGNDFTGQNRFDLGLQADSDVQLRNEYNAGATTSAVGTTITDGEWHHVAVVWDADAQSSAFYLNGADYGGETLGMDLNLQDVIGITIGGDTRAAGNLLPDVDDVGNSRFWIGDIDDVQVYDYMLDGNDMAFLHDNPGSVIPEPGSLALLGAGGLLMLRRRRG